MNKQFLLAALAAFLAVPAALANDCPGGNCGGGGGQFAGPHAKKYTRFTGWIGRGGNPKPAIAPWYLYWPYNGQFMTPGPIAPMGGAPGMGGMN